ncbi:uncharacterized protein METZ01_LOCUS5127, partial [marine metagenome]
VVNTLILSTNLGKTAISKLSNDELEMVYKTGIKLKNRWSNS